jgi:hypothetical protein
MHRDSKRERSLTGLEKPSLLGAPPTAPGGAIPAFLSASTLGTNKTSPGVPSSLGKPRATATAPQSLMGPTPLIGTPPPAPVCEHVCLVHAPNGGVPPSLAPGLLPRAHSECLASGLPFAEVPPGLDYIWQSAAIAAANACIQTLQRQPGVFAPQGRGNETLVKTSDSVSFDAVGLFFGTGSKN